MTRTIPPSTGKHQRSTYKLLERLLGAAATTPLDLLSTLVQDVVDSDRLTMTGGRLWQLDAAADEYVLVYQVGEVEFLDSGTRRHVRDMPSMTELSKSRLVVVDGDNAHGHRMYSLAGVGDPVQRPSGTLYPYAIAFTAHEQSDEYRDAMVVIGAAATTALRNMKQTHRDALMQRDLDQAWEIQRGLVPDHATSFRDYDIYGISVPDSVVGGDYFDYLRTPGDDDRLGIVVSDAASKGLPAAVQALFVSGAVRMGISFNTKITSLIARLNTLLYDTFPLERFVSLFYCELTPSANGLVLYANAGHCPPVLHRHTEGSSHLLQPTGGILGIVEDQYVGVENVNMQPGDVLVMYTDGITEAQSKTGELFGEERLQRIIALNSAASAYHIALAILEDVQHFAAGASYSDDRTLVVVKRQRQPDLPAALPAAAPAA
jgi:sigma-B regulation protein RsbU (phosphoserine phosphatase)